jgi:hypothetical protein
MLEKTLLLIFILANCFLHVHAQGVGQGTRIDLTYKLGLNNGTTGQFAQHSFRIITNRQRMES